ncbi:MAG TPA: glycosyltransferase family 87 protein, partial [Tepidisphaeraceae bacterium]|nr:glycosyltransferase family 87 protein [Tepidisphaeraceae bacterium]
RADTDQMYVYPPLIAFAYMPLTYLSLPNAAVVMLFVTAAMLLAAGLLASREAVARFGPYSIAAVVMVAGAVTILSENELRAVMTMLETDALMLLLFTLAFCWLDRRPTAAGLALGFAFNIKYLSIVALPYLILRRRWRASAATILGAVLFALLPALQLGWHEDLRCLRVSMGGLLRWVGIAPEQSGSIVVHNISDGLSVSITSATARVLGARGFTNPQVMLAAAGIGLVSLLIVAAMYRLNRLPFWLWPSAREQSREPFAALVALEWAGLITVSLAFSPNTNARHIVLTVIVNAVGAAVVFFTWRGANPVPAIVGLALIFWGYIWPFAKPIRHAGFNHYVYGVPCWFLLIGYLLILWTGLRFVSRRQMQLS